MRAVIYYLTKTKNTTNHNMTQNTTQHTKENTCSKIFWFQKSLAQKSFHPEKLFVWNIFVVLEYKTFWCRKKLFWKLSGPKNLWFPICLSTLVPQIYPWNLVKIRWVIAEILTNNTNSVMIRWSSNITVVAWSLFCWMLYQI